MTSLQDAKISLIDRGFLFGHAVFDTLLYDDKQMIEWDAHYHRLQKACERVHLICPQKKHLLADCLLAVQELERCLSTERLDHLYNESNFHENNFRFSLKIMVTGGDYPSLELPSDQDFINHPNTYIICQPVKNISIERRIQGYALKSFLDERGSFSIGIKSTNYLFSFLCLDTSKHQGFDDVLLKNANGDYTEGVTSGFLWFDKEYRMYSTPPEGNCLISTSILKIERLLIKNKNFFEYKSLNEKETTNCMGCALVSSIRGVMPIKNIDNIYFNIEQSSEHFEYLIGLFNS